MSLTQTRRSTASHDGRLQITMNGLAKRIKRVAFGMTNFLHWRIDAYSNGEAIPPDPVAT